MTVLNAETAIYACLKHLPGGAKMTVYTKNSNGARTNEVAVLKKEPDSWGDWQVVNRPKTADPMLLPETWPDGHPGIISSRTLADAFDSNPDLWADISE